MKLLLDAARQKLLKSTNASRSYLKYKRGMTRCSQLQNRWLKGIDVTIFQKKI